MKHLPYVGLTVVLLLAPSVSSKVRSQSEAEIVSAMLDDWYSAANRGDAPEYHSRFTDDAVFLGTDPKERWTISEFRALYPHPQWTYVSKDRHVLFSSDGKMGWWDEKLSSKHGEARATGVVVRSHRTWKIAQYNLSFLIPNAAVPDLIDMLKRFANVPPGRE
jgi:hypothetical protein